MPYFVRRRFRPRGTALDLHYGAVVDVRYVRHGLRFVTFEREIGVGPL